MTLIYNQKQLSCDQEVFTWHEHGMEFRPGMGHNRKRLRDPNLLVFHWTGGERGHAGIYSTLKRRKLGIHFTIDYAGTIYQYCDPALVVCAHVGRQNGRSIGVEIQNRGVPPKKYNIEDHPARVGGRCPRSLYRAALGGRQHTFCHFTLPQLHAALTLADAFVLAGIIKAAVPQHPSTKNILYTGQLSSTQQALFEGVAGHFHFNAAKIDPGVDLLNMLLAYGYCR